MIQGIAPSQRSVLFALLGAALLGAMPASAEDSKEFDAHAIDSIAVADSLINARQLSQTEALMRRMLPRVAAQYDSSSAEMATAIDRLVLALWLSGRSQAPETISLAERAIDLKLEHFGLDHIETASSLFSLGVIRTLAGNFAAADSIFVQTLEIRERHLPRLHPSVISTVGALSNVRHSASDFAGALPYARRSLEMAEELGGEAHPQAFIMRGNLANLLTELSKYNEARTLIERQIQLLEAAGFEDENLAAAYSILARIHYLIGDHEGAIPLRARCLELREALYQGNHPRLAEALLNYGTEFWRVDRLAEGREMIERARQMWEELYGSEHIHMASFYEVLGRIAQEQGDLAESRRFHERVLEIREKGLGPDAPKVAEVLESLGRLSMEEGRYAEARRDLERAIAIVSAQLGPDHLWIGEYSNQLALIELLDGNPDVAFATALNAEGITRKNLRITLRGLPERQALRYAQEKPVGLDILLSLADAANGTEVWDALIRSRALVLDEMAARHRQLQVGDASDSLWATYRDACQRLAELYVAGPEGGDVEAFAERLGQFQRDLDRAERTLGIDRDRRAGNREPTGIGLEGIRTALPEQSALIAFAQYRHFGGSVDPDYTGYRAVLLTAPDADPIWFDLGDAEVINARIALWKDEAALGALRSDRSREVSHAAYADAATALRRTIWDPIALHLGNVHSIFIVPDGEIHLVNFASLPQADDRYLIEAGYTYHYLSTERELTMRAPDMMADAGALVLGAPNFEGSQSHTAAAYRGPRAECGELRDLEFAPLPGSLEEARSVANLWGTHFSAADGSGAHVALLTGQEASESALKAYAPGNQVLHVATHGFFLSGACPAGTAGTRGIGALVPEDEPPTSRIELPENPLLLSGLALAGANRRNETGPGQDDGILTAQEIATLDLSSVRWAVLSACETGTGRVQVGEGVLGLRRAFRIAGARTLITSLWSVKDDATRDWMRAFYEASLDEGLDTRSAARAASLAVLRTRRAAGDDHHPFYWAAFIASGDWR